MIYYPMSNGRSVDEFLRLLEALQTSDENNIATPENWQAGEPLSYHHHVPLQKPKVVWTMVMIIRTGILEKNTLIEVSFILIVDIE